MPELINLSKKVLLLGDPGVGKTSLIRKFVYDMFDDNYISTLGAKVSRKGLLLDHPSKDIKVDLKLMIWDVMGQKEYSMLHQSAYLGAQGALIVCDITRKNTLDSVVSWITELFNVVGEIPIILIGNKNDLSRREITSEEGQDLAKKFNFGYIETSALNGNNVLDAFNEIAQNLLYLRKNTI